ncbi:MAG TPA: EAL domain-containing protein, partial [Usitatibacter sp.]|nr:EAL domain-containing protein [Usitatibacter sp.]
VRLRMKGFGLSIDDYGTGYSSMQRLTRVPFTELKIDQSFVKHAATQVSSRAVVESSLEIARKLGIAAVAEGVESRRDFDLVRTMGCNLVQGYYVSRPMEAGQFRVWLAARKQATA